MPLRYVLAVVACLMEIATLTKLFPCGERNPERDEP